MSFLNTWKPEFVIIMLVSSANKNGLHISGMIVGTSLLQGGSNMTGTDCGLFTHKSVPVIFEPPCILKEK